MMMMRRHGWQRPLHPLQIVGMSVFSVLVGAFYCFLGLFLGNKTAEIAVNTVFSLAAFSAAILFIRCTWIDPSDKIRRKKKNTNNKDTRGASNTSFRKYGLCMVRQLLGRVIRKMERKILKTCIRRKYQQLLPLPLPLPLPLLQESSVSVPFPHLVLLDDDDSCAPPVHPKVDCDLSFCPSCDVEVHKNSKHCRTCNRCVEGFDHHCRWLNNCVGKKNYTSFILLMVFVLLMLIVEGGTAVAIFIRCFVDRKGIILEMKTRHYTNFPRGVVAAISVLLLVITAYSTAALGQLFFFHVLLIRKGMRTYDYILAMREENQNQNQLPELQESLDDDDDVSDFSSSSDDESVGVDQKPTFISRVICGSCSSSRDEVVGEKLSIRIEGETTTTTTSTGSHGFQATINPWKLITMNQERALLAATRAKERLMMQQHNTISSNNNNNNNNKRQPPPLVVETNCTPPPLPSPAKFSSPRRRISCSTALPPATMESPERRYRRSNFSVSKELETYYVCRHNVVVLSTILRKEEDDKTCSCP